MQLDSEEGGDIAGEAVGVGITGDGVVVASGYVQFS